jgi:hypothetical protein
MAIGSLLAVSSIALELNNWLFLLIGGIIGSLITLSIIIGVFLARYEPKDDN